MEKSMPRHHSGWKGKTKKRCMIPKCKKLAKDFYDGRWLCRIHSPIREGYNKLHETKGGKIWQDQKDQKTNQKK